MSTSLGRARVQRSRGQAMLELALILPLLLTLLLGTWTVATLVGAQDQATVASRNGARLASELGNGGYTSAWSGGQVNDATQTLDREIVATVNASLSGKNTPAGVTVSEIDVYRPDPADTASHFCTTLGSATLLDRYNPDGTKIPGPPAQYTVDLRDDVLGNEALIGVRVVYTYQPPTGMFAWLGVTRYACTVMQIQPA